MILITLGFKLTISEKQIDDDVTNKCEGSYQ